ncbi:glycosyl hydrolase, partial [Flavobacteriaceae bacterium]|nr:glycosyl hydrolase [Flavobacteriaceae bacterium]
TVVKVVIRDASGNTVRQYHSETDKNYISFEGAPPKKTIASKKKGMNRLVWDLRYPLLEATPKVYIEGSFRGHKAIPGNYTISVSYGTEKLMTSVAILPNSKYPTTQAEYEEYHTFMSAGESTYNEMTRMTNKMFIAQQSLEALLPKIDTKKYPQTFVSAKATLEKVKAWDGVMVQRLAQAYDDVENFVNGFTAEYITAINQTESAIPKVNNGSKEKMAELNRQWESHKKEAVGIQKELTNLNQLLFESGFGFVPF